MTWRTFFAGSLLTLTIVAGGFGCQVSALSVPSAPPLARPIVDQTKTLNDQQIADLSSQIATSRQTKDYQVGVLIIPTLGNDESIEGYSLKVAREWGIGSKDNSNGVLLLIVKNDRRMRIEVGRGLEGDLTDVESGRILRQVLQPKFRQGNYYEGIKLALESIQAQVEGRVDPNTRADTSSKNNFVENAFFLIMFAIFWIAPWMMWIVSILARSKSWWAGGVLGAAAGGVVAWIAGGAMLALIGWAGITLFGFILDFFVSRNYKEHLAKGGDPAWWAGGTWGTGSSGGSWGGGSSGGGFGGGDFGGGGSSGSW